VLEEKNKLTSRELLRQKSHMPKDSLLYEKLIPATLVILAVVTVALIIFSAGIFFGFIQF